MTSDTEKPQPLLVMCLLAVAVGVIAGVGAWFFRVLIGLFHNLLFLGEFNTFYDANVHTPASPWGAGVILVPVVGSVVVVWLVKTFAPEAKGHGVPEVIDAIYYSQGRIRPVVAAVKSLASAICIGSGGSVGREGPIIQIGSAFGSTLGQMFRIPPRQCVTLIAAGGAGGIAATFNAPLGGLIFAMELLLVSLNARNILPVGLATVVASYIGRAAIGTHPAFDLTDLRIDHFHLSDPLLLALFVPFGIVIGLVATLFVRGIYWAEDRFEELPVNDYLRHAIGMTAVGVMIYLLQRHASHCYVQGVGYATIMDLLKGVLTDPALLVLLFVLKLVATCCTLGSGGSGGVFSPGLFMGATAGALFGLAAQTVFPSVEISTIPFVIAGMAAAIGGSTGAIVTGAVMLTEMTHDMNVGLPIIVTSTVAFGVRKWLSPDSIYTLKLMRRGHVVPQGLAASIVEAHRAGDVMETEFRTVDAAGASEPYDGVTVVSNDSGTAGVIPKKGQTIDQHFILAHRDTALVDVFRAMHEESADYALITNSTDDDSIVGVITHREIAVFQYKATELL